MIVLTGTGHIQTDTIEELNQALSYLEADPMARGIVADETTKTIDFDYSNDI